MKIVGILITLMLSLVLGNTVGFVFDSLNTAVAVSGVSFIGGMIMPKQLGILAVGFVNVDVFKANTSAPGYLPPKDIISFWTDEDVTGMPPRDDNGVRIIGNIAMNAGRHMIRIQVTEGTLIWKNMMEGDADSRAVIQSLEFEVPGYGLLLAEFLANNANKNIYAGIQFCNGATPLQFGSECAKMQMTIDTEGNKDKTYSKISLKSMKKGPVVAHYFGTFTYAQDFAIAADDVTPSISEGNGRYVIPANTGATAITGFDDAGAGKTVTLVGSGGVNASTIAHGGKFVMADGADWTGDTGSTITFEIYDADHYFEISRS